MSLFTWLEHTPVGIWVRESPWGFPISLIVHVWALAFVVGISLLLAGMSMVLFYRLAYRDLLVLGPGQTAPPRARLFTLISLLAWLGIIACGRLITFFRPPNFWCFWC